MSNSGCNKNVPGLLVFSAMASLFTRPDSKYWWISFKITEVRERVSTKIPHDDRETPGKHSPVWDLLEEKNRIERAIARGEAVDPCQTGRAPILAWVGEFLDTLDVGPSSLDRYESGLRNFTDWCGSRYKYLAQVSGSVAVKYFTSISGWAKNSKRAQRTLLTKFYDEAKRRGRVDFKFNPFESVVIKRSEPGSKAKHVLSFQEIQTILQSDMPAWLKVVAQFCLYTGSRGDNLKDLRWDDIQFEPWPVISFSRSKTTAYSVPMHPDLATCLKSAHVPELDEPYVFHELRGKSDAYLSNTFARWMKRLEIPATLHCLRHTCNTRLIESGVPKEHAMAILNHSSATVNDIYTHADAAGLIGEIGKLNYGT